MDSKARVRMHLECLYDMFRDKIEENVVYIVYHENDGRIDTTIDQLMSIAASSFTGHLFESDRKVPQTFSYASSKNINRNFNHPLIAINAPNDATNSEKRKLGFNARDDLEIKSNSNGDGDEDRDDEEVEEEGAEEESLDDQIERLQKAIDVLLLEKQTCHDKASQYLSKKMFPVTSYYSELSSQLRRKIDEKTNKLVKLLLVRSENSESIDLHGLYPVQARLVVRELLRKRQHQLVIDKQLETSIDVITGWGKHSTSHGLRIKPTIVSLLREEGFEYHRLNKGALRVTIRRV